MPDSKFQIPDPVSQVTDLTSQTPLDSWSQTKEAKGASHNDDFRTAQNALEISPEAGSTGSHSGSHSDHPMLRRAKTTVIREDLIDKSAEALEHPVPFQDSSVSESHLNATDGTGLHHDLHMELKQQLEQMQKLQRQQLQLQQQQLAFQESQILKKDAEPQFRFQDIERQNSLPSSSGKFPHMDAGWRDFAQSKAQMQTSASSSRPFNFGLGGYSHKDADWQEFCLNMKSEMRSFPSKTHESMLKAQTLKQSVSSSITKSGNEAKIKRTDTTSLAAEPNTTQARKGGAASVAAERNKAQAPQGAHDQPVIRDVMLWMDQSHHDLHKGAHEEA
eukprot:gnl/MRDRNA2_/MRDRNA2_23098_c0_seq1.p1 gnl/MRDRNA2_/MRDRNA2_23098_c0~~gnl/MRDRNA2_/MRDRNA2_23098_c0_seq1.p1  ORF type:complete len:369 (-),score=85.59 gnl/MRDRNA2_/MRDRNA2_23098_c0_seq1:196-1191(-)